MDIKPGNYIATEGLTDQQIANFLIAAESAGYGSGSTDPTNWRYLRVRVPESCDPDERAPYIGIPETTERVQGFQRPEWYCWSPPRQLSWPPEPEPSAPWWPRLLSAVAILAVFAAVMFVGVAE